MHHEGITRHRPFDIKRSSLGISSHRAAGRFMIDPSGINAPGMYGVARIDLQDRVYGAGEYAMELLGLEIVKAGSIGRVRARTSAPHASGGR